MFDRQAEINLAKGDKEFRRYSLHLEKAFAATNKQPQEQQLQQGVTATPIDGTPKVDCGDRTTTNDIRVSLGRRRRRTRQRSRRTRSQQANIVEEVSPSAVEKTMSKDDKLQSDEDEKAAVCSTCSTPRHLRRSDVDNY